LFTEYDPQAGNYRIISRKVVAAYRTMRERSRFFGNLVADRKFKPPVQAGLIGVDSLLFGLDLPTAALGR
jgi:hypothetical protein